jgi:hypothetical protein
VVAPDENPERRSVSCEPVALWSRFTSPFQIGNWIPEPRSSSAVWSLFVPRPLRAPRFQVEVFVGIRRPAGSFAPESLRHDAVHSCRLSGFAVAARRSRVIYLLGSTAVLWDLRTNSRTTKTINQTISASAASGTVNMANQPPTAIG